MYALDVPTHTMKPMRGEIVAIQRDDGESGEAKTEKCKKCKECKKKRKQEIPNKVQSEMSRRHHRCYHVCLWRKQSGILQQFNDSVSALPMFPMSILKSSLHSFLCL